MRLSKCLAVVLVAAIAGGPGVARAGSPGAFDGERSGFAKSQKPQKSNKASDRVPDDPAIFPLRVLLELGVGLGAGALGTGVGALAGVAYANNHPDADRRAWIYFSAMSGLLIGLPVGAHSGGKMAPGAGGLSHTFYGGVGGFLAGLAYAIPQDYLTWGEFMVIPSLVLGGSILGFEISHAVTMARHRRRAMLIRPKLGYDPRAETPVFGVSLDF